MKTATVWQSWLDYRVIWRHHLPLRTSKEHLWAYCLSSKAHCCSFYGCEVMKGGGRNPPPNPAAQTPVRSETDKKTSLDRIKLSPLLIPSVYNSDVKYELREWLNSTGKSLQRVMSSWTWRWPKDTWAVGTRLFPHIMSQLTFNCTFRVYDFCRWNGRCHWYFDLFLWKWCIDTFIYSQKDLEH